MTQRALIFEASKTELGHYECKPVAIEETVCKPAGEMGHEEETENEEQQAYYIEPDIIHSKPPIWVQQANHLFQQGLRGNANGGYNDYLLQIRAQFEQMRATLQSQMASFDPND